MLKFVVLGLFILSGFTSLVYQAVWIRLLSLAVGSTSESMSLVLSIFFMGLALGSFAFGRWSHRLKRPLLTYGLLEGAIGLFAMIVFWSLYKFPLYVEQIYPNGQLSWGSHFVKYFIVFLILIIPTFFMGASLPILVQLFQSVKLQISKNQKKQISILYAINTFGAVLGSFSAGFILYPRIGIDGANFLAVAGNLLIAGVCVYLQFSGRIGTAEQAEVEGKGTIRAEVSKLPEQPTAVGKIIGEAGAAIEASSVTADFKRFMYLATFATGFASISMEVIWSKYLGIFLGTNLYGLSLILSLFLLGITIGSFLLSFLMKEGLNLRKLYFYLLIGALLSTLFSVLLLGFLPILSNVLGYYLGGQLSYLSIKSALAFLVLISPTIFFGALLPLTIEILNENKKAAAETSGTVYAINTVGGILGSCFTGLLLIPQLGSSLTTRLNLGVLLLLVAGILLLSAQLRRRWIWLAAVIVILLPATLQTQLDFQNIIRSAYQQVLAPGMDLSELLKVFSRKQEDFQFVHEGETAIISLSHDADDGDEFKKYLRLKTNGLNESIYNLENRNSLPKYEALLGLIPYSLVRDPQKGFIVGYGGGYSALFFDSTDMKKVIVAEIEEGILKAATFAHQGKFPFTDSERIQVRLEDARFLLAAGSEAPFDIIASQPSHSWLSGVANLFTQEFFTLVHSRLAPGGVFSQWLNLYNMDAEVLNSILKTFFTVFPEGAVFSNLHDEELILIGSNEPLRFNIKKLEQIFASPAISQKVAEVPLVKAADLLSHLILTREEFMKKMDGVSLNTDLNAYAEIRQSRLFYGESSNAVKTYLDQLFSAEFDRVMVQKMDLTFLNEILASLYRSQNFQKYNRTLEKYRPLFMESLEGRQQLARHLYQLERYDSAANVLEESGQASSLLVSIYLHIGEDKKAELLLSQAGKSPELWCGLLELQTRQKKWKEASVTAQNLEKALIAGKSSCAGQVQLVLGSYYFYTGQWKPAQAYLAQFFEWNPQRLKVVELLLGLSIQLEQAPQVQAFSSYYTSTLESEKLRLESMHQWLSHWGYEADAAIIRRLIEQLRLGQSTPGA